MEKRKKKKANAKQIALRALAVFGATLGMLLVLVFSVLLIVNYGPSPKAHKLFVNSVRETSALKFMAKWFTTDEELKEILEGNKIEEITDVTDTSRIQTNKTKKNTPTAAPNQTDPGTTSAPAATEAAHASQLEITATPAPEVDFPNIVLREDGITICEVKGATYVGHVMIIDDPSRVKVGVCNNLGNAGVYGMQVQDIINKYGAIGGINAGGFYDPNGMGTGSIPLGYVFSEGELLYNDISSNLLIGFTDEDVFVVGNMDSATAKNMHIRDAVTFGPALIVNGNAAAVTGLGSGLNPRTAIGQRADGKVLMIAIDGRQANSLGATYADLIKIFQDFGAVNAANLDGGSSTVMYYKGEKVSTPANFINSRNMPTAIIVTK